MKDSVISRCGKSKTEEIRPLLAKEQLRDKKLSELLCIMQRRAASHSITNNLFLELCMQQLPRNIQSILASMHPLTPQNATEIADRILEVSPVQINSTDLPSVNTSDTPLYT